MADNSNTEDNKSTLENIKLLMAYKTYRKGIVEKELEFISNLGRDIEVLEMGSSDGWLSNEILKLENVKSITSLDISLNDENIHRYSDRSFAVKGDLNKIDRINILNDNKFNVIITHGTLHHLVDPFFTLNYSVNHLLKEDGVLIINDTWINQPLQIKTNAFIYIASKIVPPLKRLNIKASLNFLLHKLPRVLFSYKYACSIAHVWNSSPFESISSANDYRRLYTNQNLELLFFKRFGALAAYQNSWEGYPKVLKDFFENIGVKHIDKLDSWLIKRNIFEGDCHVAILKKMRINEKNTSIKTTL